MREQARLYDLDLEHRARSAEGGDGIEVIATQVGQSRKHSLLEALVNIAVGYGVAVAANFIVLPLFGLVPSAVDAFGIGLIFTAISLLRSYCLRRAFNWWHIKRGER